jgi:uncharacterized protein
MNPRNFHNKLLIFTRYPTPGKVKTRLIPKLGVDGAAKLHKFLTEHVVAQALKLAKRIDVSVEIVFADSDFVSMRTWLGEDPVYSRQADGDLGERMRIAFEQAFDSGASKVVLIGSDLPDLSVSILAAAFEELGNADVALGPAADGGYYLIGLKAPFPELFTGIRWSRPGVLENTLEKIQGKRKTYGLTEMLNDVDVPKDLERFEESGRDGISCLLNRLLRSP